MTPKPLNFDSNGWLIGVRHVPSPNQNGGLSAPMNGVVMHTMVGDKAYNWFANPAAQASAHFCVEQDGTITQCVSCKGGMAWHCSNGNNMYFGIEHADHGNPKNPLTRAQMEASAQIVEALSYGVNCLGGFPLRVGSYAGDKGYVCHGMGGASWGGHSCPDYPVYGVGPRSKQRGEIIAIAKDIRDVRLGKKKPSSPSKPTVKPIDPGQKIKPGFFRHVANGTVSLNEYAKKRGTTANFVTGVTEHPDCPISKGNLEKFVNYRISKGTSAAQKAASSDVVMPSGLVFYTVNP